MRQKRYRLLIKTVEKPYGFYFFVLIFMESGDFMATRLETLQSRLDAYQKCELSILDGAQSYAIGSRNLTRANLHEISEMIKYLEKEVAQEESKASGGGRNRVMGVIPRDI
jgi:hypothetical protein